MSEKEKKVVEKLKEAIPKMSDFDKGYILGKVENMAETEKKKKEKEWFRWTSWKSSKMKNLEKFVL